MSESDISDPQQRAVVPADVLREWNRSAEQLFSSALSRTDIYERVTVLIGSTVQLLRARHAGATDLLAACAAPDALLAEVVGTDPALSIDGLDPAKLVAAASAMRYREVVDENAALARKAALAAGAADSWVVLYESGPFAGNPLVPYQRLEGHAAMGLAIAVGVRPDDDFVGCVHSVDVVQLDPATGGLGGRPVGADLSAECTTADVREANVERIKAALAVGHGQKN